MSCIFNFNIFKKMFCPCYCTFSLVYFSFSLRHDRWLPLPELASWGLLRFFFVVHVAGKPKTNQQESRLRSVRFVRQIFEWGKVAMVTVCHLSMVCKALYLFSVVCSLLLIFLPCVPSLSHNKHKAQKDTCTCNKEHMCEGRTEINCHCDRMDTFLVSSGMNASFFSWWNTTTKLNVL